MSCMGFLLVIIYCPLLTKILTPISLWLGKYADTHVYTRHVFMHVYHPVVKVIAV